MYNFWRELSPPSPPPHQPIPHLDWGLEEGGIMLKRELRRGRGDSEEMEKVRKVAKVQGADRSLPETRKKWIFINSIKNKHDIASYYSSLNEPFTVTLDQIN